MQPREGPTPKPGFYVLKTDGGITAEQGAAGPAAIGVVLKDHKYRDVDEAATPTYKPTLAGTRRIERTHRG